MLEQEIDLVFQKLQRKGTDPDVACAAVKQLIRGHFAAADAEKFDVFTEILFRRYNGFNTTIIANELKVRIRQIRTSSLQVEQWLNA
ncbi:MAG TPA: hypothetical protein VG839_09740 [Asticcacaulis sp.]|nr:hypothetical protein [Asticcacaulis sp.]